MSGLKNRRGRPRRNNITALQQQHQTSTTTQFDALNTLHVNVKQPLTILKVNRQRDNSDNDPTAAKPPAAIAQEVQGVQLSRLPKVGFTQREELTDDSISDNEEQKLQEQQLLLQHHGDKKYYNQAYRRPENHYIHYIEPSESELYESVEYDMDDQDRDWLRLLNKERSKELLGDISPTLFEMIMDKLEKEWFNLIKDAPKLTEPQVILPEDSACAVCDDTEVENSNAIVFCDGCNVAVHQDCYGIPYIPEGQWLCRKCMISPEFPVSCIFCPNEGGAFKQTNTNQWGHLLCAIWIPEIGVSNTIYMEPIDMIENVPKSRWKLTCFICRKKEGACIQCDNKHCFSAFHVTCAKSAKLCMKMNTHSSEGVVLKAYCDKHTPKEHDRVLNVPAPRGRGRGRGRGASNLNRDHFNNNKVARAHQLHYTTGAPIAPDTILVKIENLPCVRTASIRKRPDLVTAIAHYWSLKRESRRGAPLLKRLHLEPWTASPKHSTGGTDQLIRRSVITQLRADLDKVRILSEQVQKRERQKLERTKTQKMYIERILFPLEHELRPILQQFMEIDRKKFFLNHVTPQEAADYSSVIKHSMCFSEIYQKLSLHEYTELDQFKNDVSLIWENCMEYNKEDTSFYKVATKLKAASEKLFVIAEQKMSRYELNQGIWDVPVDESIFEYKATLEDKEKKLNEPEVQQQEDTQEETKVAMQPTVAENAVQKKREPKQRRPRKIHQVDPAALNKLRTRLKPVAIEEPPQPQPSSSLVKPSSSPSATKLSSSKEAESAAISEANVQSLTIQTETTADPYKQTSITSYFAEQQRKEKLRIEERERKRLAKEAAQIHEQMRLAEEEAARQHEQGQHEKREKHKEKRRIYERERRARQKQRQLEELAKQKQASPPTEEVTRYDTEVMQPMQTFPPAQVTLHYDIETMQPIRTTSKPLTPPSAIGITEQSYYTPLVPMIPYQPASSNQEEEIVYRNSIEIAASELYVNSSQLAESTNTIATMDPPTNVVTMNAPTIFTSATTAADTNTTTSVIAETTTTTAPINITESRTTMEPATMKTTVMEPISTADSTTATKPIKKEPKPISNSKKRKLSFQPTSRTTRRTGLKASIEEITKRPKISQEARTLFASYNGVSHLEKPVEVYKENRKKSAPLGWVYVKGDEEEDASDGESFGGEEEEIPPQKHGKRKRNTIPVPDFKNGEIVWARVSGYPSHPAKFSNLPDDKCLPKVLASRRYQGDVLVEFLCVPEIHKWGWVERGCICEVGDPEEDKKRLSESLKKRPKRNALIQEAKDGYRHAASILGFNPEPTIDAVFNQQPLDNKRKRKASKRNA